MGVFYKVYDKSGKFLKEIDEDKANELNKNEYLAGVACFVIQRGKLLFEVREPSRIDGGKLNLFSGHSENDENPAETCVRELREELDLAPSISRDAVEIGKYTVILKDRPTQKAWHLTIFRVKVPWYVRLRPQKGEVHKIKRASGAKAKKIMEKSGSFVFPYDDEFAKFFNRHVRPFLY